MLEMLYFLQNGIDYAISTEKLSPTFSQIRFCLDEQLKFCNKKATLSSSTVVTTKHSICFWRNHQGNTSIRKVYKRQQYGESTLSSIKKCGGTSRTPPLVADDFLLEPPEACPD